MKHLALMIGIDEYPHLKKAYHLKGCANDQLILYNLLTKQFYFEKNNIELLLNREATRANILEALDSLAGIGEYEGEPVVDEGDIVFISYSGHGSRLRDESDSQKKKRSYEQYTIIPSDSSRVAPIGLGGANLDITDDEIFVRLQKIQERAAHVVLLLDCSYHNTVFKNLSGSPTRSLPLDYRYKDVPQLTDSVVAASSNEEQPSRWSRLNEKCILITACRDNEAAYEYCHPQTKETYGGLSYHVVSELVKNKGQMTYSDLFSSVTNAVHHIFNQQHPQIIGKWDLNRRVFSIDEVKSKPFAVVQARVDPYQLKLDVGSAHGVTIGSVWEIKPAYLADESMLANVTIRQVGALQSLAESDERLPNTVRKGCRAIEVLHQLSDLRISVAVDGTNRAKMSELRDKIEQSSLLKLAKEGPVELVAVLLPPRSGVDRQNINIYAPKIGTLEEPTWVIIGRDRHMLPSPPHPMSEDDALDATFSNLETWARYLNLHRIRPIGPDPLHDKFIINLSFPEGSPLPIDEESGLPLITHGYNVRLELRNDHSEPLYYVLFSFDAMGGVTRLWPPAETKEPIMPYERYPLEFPLTLPDNFPSMLERGKETLKAMVTTQYVNFDMMEQEGSRMSDSNELATLYQAATESGSVVAVTPMSNQIDQTSWTVVQLDYQIKRN